MLSKVAWGNAARKRLANSTDNTSPLHDQSFVRGTLCARFGAWSNKLRNSEGTSTMRVTPSRASVRSSSSGSYTTSWGIIKLGTPASNGPKISQTESTNPKFVFWQQTSSGWYG